MKKAQFIMLTLLCVVSLFCLAQGLSEPVYNVVEQLDVKVNMRDGVILSTDLCLPDSIGEFPVLLMRTPYGKNGERKSAYFFARHGYAVVIQDTRGRENSEGVFNAFQSEAFDGRLAKF